VRHEPSCMFPYMMECGLRVSTVLEVFKDTEESAREAAKAFASLWISYEVKLSRALPKQRGSLVCDTAEPTRTHVMHSFNAEFILQLSEYSPLSTTHTHSLSLSLSTLT
jgi:hypothetical protein